MPVKSTDTEKRLAPRTVVQPRAEDKKPVAPGKENADDADLRAIDRTRTIIWFVILALLCWTPIAVISFLNFDVIVTLIVMLVVMVSTSIALVRWRRKSPDTDASAPAVQDVTAKAPALRKDKTIPAWVEASRPRDEAPARHHLYYRLYASGLYRLPFVRAPKINYPSPDELHDRQYAVSSDAKNTMTVVSPKGGVGKTPTAAGISAAGAASPPAGTVSLVDFDAGGDSQVPSYFGIEPTKTMSVMEFYKLRERLKRAPTRAELVGARIDRAFGVRIFSSRSEQWPTREQATEIINGIAQSTDITVVDCPPGADVAASVAARAAGDVIVIPCLYDKRPSWQSVKNLLAKQDVADRRSDVFVAVSAVPARLNTERTRHDFANKFGLPVEQVVIVEFSSHIHHHTKMDRNLVGERTWRAYNLIVTLAMEHVAAKRRTEQHPVATPIPEGEL